MAEHWCPIHEAVFFKKGKMRGYAHPIEGTDPVQWCNEEDLEKVKNAEPQTQGEEKILPEHQAEIDKAKSEGRQSMPPPAPQAVGMITKEIGDNIRARMLDEIYGEENAPKILAWYRGQTFGITRINFDGKDLPKMVANVPPKYTNMPNIDEPQETFELKNAGEFMQAVSKHGKEYTSDWVKTQLSLEQLPDIPKAYGSYKEAYQILKEQEGWEQ